MYFSPNDRGRLLSDVTGELVMSETAGRSIRAGAQGQSNRPVTRWFATMRVHIEVESHLESTRLDMADMDPDIVAVKSQPFSAKGVFRGEEIAHVPDFLMRRRNGCYHLVNVKARWFFSDDFPDRKKLKRTRRALAWAEQLAHDRGWTYELFTDDDLHSPRITRPQTLHCFSNPDDYVPELIDAIQRSEGQTRREIAADLGDRFGDGVVRAGVLHAMWLGLLIADPDVPLSDDLLLHRTSRPERLL